MTGCWRIMAVEGWKRDRQSVEEIRDQVRAFEEGTEATDDLTVMAMRYLGQA